MLLPFNEAKATQAAAVLLKLRGGRMKYLKLIKLLYLADREALLRWGRPITTDRFVSMDHGPVVSRIFDLISSEPAPDDRSLWHRHIKTVDNWDVKLESDPDNGELSPAEEELLAEIFSLHGNKYRWDLVRELHGFPEWRDSQGSSSPITYADIFRAAGREYADEMLGDLEALATTEHLLGR